MASHYHPVTPEVIAKLKVIVGDENVRCDEETLIQYQTDEEGNPHYFRKPEVVVFPGSTEEVAAIVKLANEFLVPITPARPARMSPAAPFRSITAWSWKWSA